MSAHHSNKWLRAELKEATRLLGSMTDLAQYHVDQIQALAEEEVAIEEAAERGARAAKARSDYSKAEAFIAKHGARS